MASVDVHEIVTTTLYLEGDNRPFGELSREQVRGRADELRATAGWGPTARVAPVARAWRELLMAMEREGAEVVSALDEVTLRELAPKLWIVPPGGGLLL